MSFSPYHPIQLALGLSIWIIWFGAIYGGLSLGCAIAEPPSTLGPLTWINAMLLVATIATSVLLAWCSVKTWRARAVGVGDSQKYIATVAAGVHGVAAIATIAVGLPILVLPPCV